jgi:hypothetical protein
MILKKRQTKLERASVELKNKVPKKTSLGSVTVRCLQASGANHSPNII